MEIFWLIVVLAVLGGMWWVGYRMEPHWVSRDGQRFMCSTQEFSHGTVDGRPRESQVAFLPDDSLHITHKRMMRRKRSVWLLSGKSPEPPKGLEIFVVQAVVDGVPQPTMLALRIPRKSHVVELLDKALEREVRRVKESPQETAATADQPDQD